MDLTSLIVWLIVGGLIGWIASMIMGTDAQQGVLLNIVVGVDRGLSRWGVALPAVRHRDPESGQL